MHSLNEMTYSCAASVEVVGVPEETILQEHGLLGVLALWRRWAGDNFAPAWKNVDLLEMASDLRGGTSVLDFMSDTGDFRVRYWGLKLVDAFEIEMTGKLLSAGQDRGVMDGFRDTVQTMLTAKKPQYLSQAITSSNGVRRLFPVLRLPISDDGEMVTKVMTIENIPVCLRTLYEDAPEYQR
ncbi:MAG: hypothetical protein RH946_06460 [Rhodospirillales bacterium]